MSKGNLGSYQWGLGDLRAGQLILGLSLQPFPLSAWYPPFLTEPLRLESDIIGVGKSLGPNHREPRRKSGQTGCLGSSAQAKEEAMRGSQEEKHTWPVMERQ